MKRAEAQVISSPFFQFYKAAHHIDNINTAEYLLYSIWADQIIIKSDCEYPK